MPNVWTHMLFGNRSAEKAKFEPAQNQKRFYQLGAQGPDPFFYHRFWPWQKDGAAVIGSKIHYEKCGDFLKGMIESGVKADEQTRAYIGGFITHHLLDRTVHPYINFRSGTEGNRHQKLEIILDTILMDRLQNIDTVTTPVYKEIDIGPDLYRPIDDLLERLIETHFEAEHKTMPEGYIGQSYRDMKQALKVLFDPYGWKNKLLGERISPFSYEKKLPNADFLNLNKTEWRHPAVEEEIYTKSFLELMEEAEAETVELLQLIQQYWQDPTKKAFTEISEKLGNISYDTGKPCDGNFENRLFEPLL